MPAARDGDLEFQMLPLIGRDYRDLRLYPSAHSILLQLNRSPYLTNMPQPRSRPLARVGPHQLSDSVRQSRWFGWIGRVVSVERLNRPVPSSIRLEQ